jgi:hypothetical protein
MCSLGCQDRPVPVPRDVDLLRIVLHGRELTGAELVPFGVRLPDPRQDHDAAWKFFEAEPLDEQSLELRCRKPLTQPK